MSTKPTFSVTGRTESGKGVARKLRAAGQLPAVCYGMNSETISVVADPDALYKLLTGPRRRNIVFRLEIEGGSSFDYVMVKEYQIDPIKRDLVHADFVVVDPNKKVKVTVPVETTGRSRGEREGGKLRAVRPQVELMARPDDIPEKLTHDISDLGLGAVFLASDLALPEGVEPGYKADFAVYQIAVPRGAAAKGKG